MLAGQFHRWDIRVIESNGGNCCRDPEKPPLDLGVSAVVRRHVGVPLVRVVELADVEAPCSSNKTNQLKLASKPWHSLWPGRGPGQARAKLGPGPNQARGGGRVRPGEDFFPRSERGGRGGGGGRGRGGLGGRGGGRTAPSARNSGAWARIGGPRSYYAKS
jgi:hypothetical protein